MKRKGKKHLIAGIPSTVPPPVTGSIRADVTTQLQLRGYYSTSLSTKERADKWFFDHIQAMENPHQGMILLMLLFPLYEKYLRALGYIEPEHGFSEGHDVFKKIGNDLAVDARMAFLFWNHCRNGLLHRAVIKESDDFTAVLDRDNKKGPAIALDGDVFILKPFIIRERLLKVLMADTKMWKVDGLTLPVEYKFKKR